MVCGPIEGDPADPSGATITNPILIVEVLSASTEEEDRGNKWQHYQLIPSLLEYVLVSQTHPRVESYRRLPSSTGSRIGRGRWWSPAGAGRSATRLWTRRPPVKIFWR